MLNGKSLSYLDFQLAHRSHACYSLVLYQRGCLLKRAPVEWYLLSGMCNEETLSSHNRRPRFVCNPFFTRNNRSHHIITLCPPAPFEAASMLGFKIILDRSRRREINTARDQSPLNISRTASAFLFLRRIQNRHTITIWQKSRSIKRLRHALPLRHRCT